jgi:hypothetical protein
MDALTITLLVISVIEFIVIVYQYRHGLGAGGYIPIVKVNDTALAYDSTKHTVSGVATFTNTGSKTQADVQVALIPSTGNGQKNDGKKASAQDLLPSGAFNSGPPTSFGSNTVSWTCDTTGTTAGMLYQVVLAVWDKGTDEWQIGYSDEFKV